MSSNRSEDSYIYHDIIPALESYGYPGAGQTEKLKIKDIKIKIGSSWLEPDVVYYENGDPILLVEAKKGPGSNPIEQAFSYIKLFPSEKYSRSKVRPKYFATTEGRHITGFYHYVPKINDNGELDEDKEKLSTIPSYQELLDFLGMATTKPTVTANIFKEEIFNTILRAHAVGKKEVDPELILIVVRQLYEYFLDSKEYNNKYPFSLLDGHPDRKQEVRRALKTYSWQDSNHSEIAYTFKDLIKRAFQGDKAQLNQHITPSEIINFMIQLVNLKESDHVLDFECGSGGFLAASINLQRSHKNITGIEINELPYYVAKTFIALYQNIRNEEVNSIPIILGNGLLGTDEKYDVIISNPAGGNKYDPEGELGDITKVIQSLSNDIDIDGIEDRGYSEYYFSVQRAVTSAKLNARICLILPEGLFANQTNNKLRKYITKHSTIKAIVSLPRHIFSKGTTTKKIKPGGRTSSQKFSILFCTRNNMSVGDSATTLNDDYPVFLSAIDDKANLENKLAAIYEQYQQWSDSGNLIEQIKIKKPIPKIKSKTHQPTLIDPEYPLFSELKKQGEKPKQTVTTTIADSLKTLFK